MSNNAKGRAQANAAMSNQYLFELDGLPDIYFTRIGELQRMLVTTELADKTKQTTGQVQPGETELEQYVHHEAERVALEQLHQAAVDGKPGHKIDGTLHLLGADGTTVKASWLVQGVIIKGRKLPELQAKEDGEALKIVWSIDYDDVLPL